MAKLMLMPTMLSALTTSFAVLLCGRARIWVCAMGFLVLALGKGYEVLRAIVGAVAIDMVHLFRREQVMAIASFPHHSVLGYVASLIGLRMVWLIEKYIAVNDQALLVRFWCAALVSIDVAVIQASAWLSLRWHPTAAFAQRLDAPPGLVAQTGGFMGRAQMMSGYEAGHTISVVASFRDRLAASALAGHIFPFWQMKVYQRVLTWES